jgi:hypothetical protein
MKILSFESLKKNRCSYGFPENTNDLVNGLFVTINTTSNDFDYTNAYELLPEITSVFYECIGCEPNVLKLTTISPNKDDIDRATIRKILLVVCSIGANRDGQKTHIHMWIYNLHLFNHDYGSFCRDLNRKLKSLKGISRRNEFSVKLIPCTDALDAQVRASEDANQIIVNYIKNREFNTLMNYFSTKNSPNFIYFY